MRLVKSIVLLLALFFLFAGNIGVNVFKHICEKDGVTVSYFYKPGNEHCQDHIDELPPCCKKEEKKKDCCDDEVEYFKINLDYYNAQSQSLEQLPLIISAKQHSAVINFPEIQNSISNYVHPPPLIGREILILKQVLVI